MGTVHSVSRALTGTQSYSSERSASVFGEHASDKGPRLNLAICTTHRIQAAFMLMVRFGSQTTLRSESFGNQVEGSIDQAMRVLKCKLAKEGGVQGVE
jgi:hypothetical protein